MLYIQVPISVFVMGFRDFKTSLESSGNESKTGVVVSFFCCFSFILIVFLAHRHFFLVNTCNSCYGEPAEVLGWG